MGSLQSEIQKTLSSWEAPKPVVQRNKSLAWKSFDYLKANPSSTSEDVANALGMDIGRSSATLLSLYQKGKLDRKAYPNPNPDGKRHEVFAYWTTTGDYTDKVAVRIPKKPTKKAKPLSEVEPLLPDFDIPLRGNTRSRINFDMPRMKQVAEPEFMPEPLPFDADAFVATLNVHDAKKIYNLLRKIFG